MKLHFHYNLLNRLFNKNIEPKGSEVVKMNIKIWVMREGLNPEWLDINEFYFLMNGENKKLSQDKLILRFLKGKDWQTANEISENTNLNYGSVSGQLYTLTHNNKLEKRATTRGINGKPCFEYRLL